MTRTEAVLSGLVGFEYSYSQEAIKRFAGLPVIGKLRYVVHQMRLNRGEPPKYELGVATMEALTMDSEERERSGISIIAIASLDPIDNKKLLLPQDKILTYPVFVLFPYSSRVYQCLRTSRTLLGRAFAPTDWFSSLPNVDELIVANADLRQESSLDKFRRVAREVKITDELINPEKEKTHMDKSQSSTTERMDELNGIKTDRIVQFLQMVTWFKNEYPDWNEDLVKIIYCKPDGKHCTLLMRPPGDNWNIIDRISNPKLRISPKGVAFVVSTVINTNRMNNGEKAFLSGSRKPADISHYEMIKLFRELQR